MQVVCTMTQSMTLCWRALDPLKQEIDYSTERHARASSFFNGTDTSVVLMKGYISFFQRKGTAPEQELTELWLV